MCELNVRKNPRSIRQCRCCLWTRRHSLVHRLIRAKGLARDDHRRKRHLPIMHFPSTQNTSWACTSGEQSTPGRPSPTHPPHDSMSFMKSMHYRNKSAFTSQTMASHHAHLVTPGRDRTRLESSRANSLRQMLLRQDSFSESWRWQNIRTSEITA